MFQAFLPPVARKKRRRPAPAAVARPRSLRSAPLGTPSRPAASRAPAGIGKGSWRHGRFTGAAGSRAYRLYVPRGIRRSATAPLLVALHGCGQDGLDFAAGTRFNDLADRHQFVVVYPEQSSTHNGQRCWNWFRPAHQSRGAGEPAIIAGIVRKVVQEASPWRIDPSRIYVTGISAGGAMAVVLAATYPELFAAVGVHSAPPYRSASGPANALAAMRGAGTLAASEHGPLQPMPPMVVFQGTSDSTVRSTNGQRVADQWLECRTARGWDGGGLGVGRPDAPVGALSPVGPPRTTTALPVRPISARSRRGYRVSRWYAGGRKVLELWLVEGLGHAWSGGSAAGSYSDLRGPRASTEMWKFFASHRSTTADAELAG